MRIFALIWIVTFLVAIPFAVRADAARRRRRMWEQLATSTRDLQRAFAALNAATIHVAVATRRFTEAYAEDVH